MPRPAARDVAILFSTRAARMFGYGLVSVVLVLYLTRIGLDEPRVGLLFSLTLAGDLLISLWMTTRADRLGRRRMLVAGALLMAGAGVVFVSTSLFPLLLAAAIIGVISPGGNDVGPFLPIEQAAISEEVDGPRRTHLFARYNLVGSLATALGALVGGAVISSSRHAGLPDLTAYRAVLLTYAALGLALAAAFLFLSPAIEPHRAPLPGQRLLLGLHASRGIVLRIASLFAVDAFAGALVLQSFMVYWFTVRWNLDARTVGALFFGANVLSGFSGLVAARLAVRFGLLNTMVFTHVPSNLLLILVPLMPTAPLAMAVLLARFSISQMDVPTRQSFVASVVSPDERSAAGGVTNVFRSFGTMGAPLLAGLLFARPSLRWVPFAAAGTLKIAYDVALLVALRRVEPVQSRT